MCAGSGLGVTVLVVLAALLHGDSAANIFINDDKITVLPELADHAALDSLDLMFCGTGSESQISRGPLGCGFPSVGDHPWLVALGYRSSVDGSLSFRCSGALISDSLVLTSARCAVGTEAMTLTTIRAGEYNLTSPKDCLWYEPDLCVDVQEAGIANVLPHPEFFNILVPGKPSLFDIAVVQLDRKLTVSYGVNSICLPMFPARHPPNKMFSLSFGLHSQPEAPPTPEAGATCCSCNRNRNTSYLVMDDERLIDYNATYNSTEPCQYRLLAEGSNTGENQCIGAGDPCIADLGAPLVAPDKFGSSYYLLGVATAVPFRRECLRTSGAAVFYLPVQMHLEWILDAVNCLENGRCVAL